MAEAAAWIEKYKQFWEQNFQRLDTLLEVLQTPINPADLPKSKR